MDGRTDLLSGESMGEVDRPLAGGSGGGRDGRSRGRRGVAGITGRAGAPIGGLLDRDWSSARAEPVGDAARIARGTAKPPIPPAEAIDGYGETRQPFGQWLLAQRNRDGLIGMLVEGARKDPGFPKQGDPEDVRSRLRALQVEGDIFEAVDDAETDWLSY